MTCVFRILVNGGWLVEVAIMVISNESNDQRWHEWWSK